LQSPMPLVDVEDTNFAPYAIHLPVACGRFGRSRWARADASATGPNPAVFPRPEFAGGSRIHTKLAQPAPRDDSTRRNFSRFGTLDRTREQAGSASLPRSAILGASSQRLEFEPPHASSLDVTETRACARPRTMACRYRARISREGNSVL